MPDGRRGVAGPATAHAFPLALSALAITGSLLAQARPASIATPALDLRSAVTVLPPASYIRVATPLWTYTGRVVRRSDDSLTVYDPTSAEHWTIALAHIDTVWVPDRKRDRGALTGVLVGSVLAGALLFAGRGGRDDVGITRILAALALAGGIVIGTAGAARNESWTRVYPPL